MSEQPFHTFESRTGSSVVYPVGCQSMQCGDFGGSCKGCEAKPVQDAFKRWVAEHKAVRLDLTWCPSIYTAQQ